MILHCNKLLCMVAWQVAASEALGVQGESPATATAAPASSATSPRWPQLIPVAHLVAIVLGVFAIIWNQQQTTDNLRSCEPRWANCASRWPRTVLARIEGFLGIGIPDSPPEG